MTIIFEMATGLLMGQFLVDKERLRFRIDKRRDYITNPPRVAMENTPILTRPPFLSYNPTIINTLQSMIPGNDVRGQPPTKETDL
jgi:hypothetical protein